MNRNVERGALLGSKRAIGAAFASQPCTIQSPPADAFEYVFMPSPPSSFRCFTTILG